MYSIKFLHAQFLVGLKFTTWNVVPKITRLEGEKYFKDPNKNNATYPFPFMEEEGSIDLSVIVPSYNEEERCKFPGRVGWFVA